MSHTTATSTFEIEVTSGAKRSCSFTFDSLKPCPAVAGSEPWTFSHSGLAPLHTDIIIPKLNGSIRIASIECEIGTEGEPKLVSGARWTAPPSFESCWNEMSILGKPSKLQVKITVNLEDTFDGIPASLLHAPEDAASDSDSDAETDATPTPTASLAKLANKLLSTPSIGDVQFRFSRDGSTQSLWANSDALREISPYFASLLSGDFQEGSLSSSSRSALKESACADDDSDDDSDLALPHFPSATSAFHPVHTVDITAHSYWTYRAVLNWTTSSHILFAPFTSTFSPTELSGIPMPKQRAHTNAFTPSAIRRDWIRKAILENAETGSVPVSPKSVYRLAHFLELDALKPIALAAIKSNLRASNVLQELLGETAGAYEEVRKVEMEFAVAHWADVKKQRGARVLASLDDDSSDSPNKRAKSSVSAETTKRSKHPPIGVRTGVCISWTEYDKSRFYGGILDDEAGKLGLEAVHCSPKVLLNTASLIAGQRVEFEYFVDGGKSEAYRVKVIETTPSPTPSLSPSPPPPKSSAAPDTGPTTCIRAGRGKVVSFKQDKGYGFIMDSEESTQGES
ncbi:hypothetical protein RQP46_009536 [Phenoliferia psychrophenolica]